MFSGLFGGGGSSKRQAQVAADAAAGARAQVKAGEEKYGAYYDPYRTAGTAAIGSQQGVLSDVSNRISAIDPKIAALYQQQAALQPQVSEMYTLSQQQDPILAKLLSGDMNAYQQTPGYDFRMQEGQRALERSAAGRGQLFSGQTGKALTKYGQDYGTSEYDNYINRLRANMGDVGTQMQGRTAALGAGQNQINAGVNLLSQDYNQIAAQMGLSSAYQNLINQGMDAADAAARLGMDATNVQAGYTDQIGKTYAAGMAAKDAQMKAAGDQWLNLGAATLTGGASTMMPGGGLFNTASAGQQNFGGGMAQIQPYSTAPGYGQQGVLQGFKQGFQQGMSPTAYSMQPQGIYSPVNSNYIAPGWKNPDIVAAQKAQSQTSYRA